MIKLRFFTDRFAAVRSFLIRACPPAEELVAGEFTPALICHVVLAQLDALVSNFIFLTDFYEDRFFPPLNDLT
jgi:hypothetical protein